MSTQAAATRRTHHPRTRTHHMHVHRVALSCWSWDCPCGGGIHTPSHGLPDQPSALIAALVHYCSQAGE